MLVTIFLTDYKKFKKNRHFSNSFSDERIYI